MNTSLFYIHVSTFKCCSKTLYLLQIIRVSRVLNNVHTNMSKYSDIEGIHVYKLTHRCGCGNQKLYSMLSFLTRVNNIYSYSIYTFTHCMTWPVLYRLYIHPLYDVVSALSFIHSPIVWRGQCSIVYTFTHCMK